jgi:serine/threonine-protein kinase RsbT
MNPSPRRPPRRAAASPTLNEEVLQILAKYVSPPTAQSILKLAEQRAGTPAGIQERRQFAELLEPLGRSVRFFVADADAATKCIDALAALATSEAPAARVEVPSVAIRTEDDVARARTSARDLASSLGFSTLGQTRVATAVSELARNIVQYAGEGEIELRASDSPAAVHVVARDRGPGIPNLEDILAGNYRSRTGMGMGLRGVKRLSEAFSVETRRGAGTTVTLTMTAR